MVTPYKYATVVSYIVTVAMWVVVRLYVFPIHVIRASSIDPFVYGWIPWSEAHAWIPQTLLLLVLYTMHLYWFIQLVKAASIFLRTGKRVDVNESDASQNKQPL